MQTQKLNIIALLLLVSTSIYAQRDFRKGYVITNQGDTIHGWIDYRGDARNARMCSFRTSESEPTTDYAPGDIAAYRFADSKYYVSRDIGAKDAPRLVFLEYLVNGLAKVYFFRDESSNDHYFIEKDGRFTELKLRKREVEVDGRNFIRTDKSYVGILKATFNTWEMNRDIEKARLEHSSLIDLAVNYHHLTCPEGSECIVYERRKPLVELRIGPAFGADLSSLTMLNRDYEVLKMNPSTNFTVGANLNFSMPRINEKFFLQMQAMYSRYYFFGAYELERSSTDVHIKGNLLQLGLAVKYEYPKGRWRPTLAAGGAGFWLPGGTIKENTDRHQYGEIRPSSDITDFSTNYMYGFGIIPGVHHYLSSKRIIFVQAQYLQYKNSKSHNLPNIRSIGLSAGIYF